MVLELEASGLHLAAPTYEARPISIPVTTNGPWRSPYYAESCQAATRQQTFPLQAGSLVRILAGKL